MDVVQVEEEADVDVQMAETAFHVSTVVALITDQTAVGRSLGDQIGHRSLLRQSISLADTSTTSTS